MTPPYIGVAVLAGLSSLALAVAGLFLGRPGWIKRSFGFGMVMFGVESFATAMLLGGPQGLRAHIFWLNVLEGARIAAPLAWLVFVGSITRPYSAALPPVWRAGLTAGGTLAPALFGALVTLGGFGVSLAPGRFERASLTTVGVASSALQLVLTVAVLAGLEACLRTSRGVFRYRIKYLILGLGGLFLVRFYVLSQAALFHEITATELNVGTATLLIGNLVLTVSLARARLPEAQAVSRAVVYRSVTFVVLSAYLLAVGGLGWLLTYLQIPESVFWVTLVVFVSTLALAAVLLSDHARWRVKRFIVLNFYRSKYDYREQWMGFTKRLSTHLTLEDLSPELLETITEAVSAEAAMLYVADASSHHYHPAASIRLREAAPASQPPDTPLLAALAALQEPLVLESDLDWGGSQLAETFRAGSVIVPLCWRGTLTGFIVLGPERMGLPYTPEDIEFMTAMGQQATGAIVTARLSEDLARAREFDAFARVASFVIHDLKNLISSLSLLSQNAVKYFDDPEFQKDTILTLSRIVERMQALLARLSSRAEPIVPKSDAVDLPSVVRDAIGAVAIPGSVKLATELAPVPAVLGDPEALLRVIQNLVTNAVQAVGGEGTVTVTVKHEDGNAVLAVADTGCGMSEEFVRRSLFVPFRTTKPGGWGIGLYQVKEIVERHGGKVTVTSKERSGTTFQVTLPTMTARAR